MNPHRYALRRGVFKTRAVRAVVVFMAAIVAALTLACRSQEDVSPRAQDEKPAQGTAQKTNPAVGRRVSQPPGRKPNLAVFSKDEQLTYRVSYMGIGLGTVSTRVVEIDTGKDRFRIKTECLMRSYKGVKFVNLHTLFQSTVDRNLASISFSAKERQSDTLHKYIHYKYDFRHNEVVITERIGNEPAPEKTEKVPLEGRTWQDGLSLLYYARAFSHTRDVDSVPVLIYHTKARTLIRFGREREEQEIDKVDYPIRTVKLDGETGFTGVFGLTGGFEGWFTDDQAAVPLVAKMHVLIGSVRLELIEWKRSAWEPPAAKER